jgi:hypothetical protein
MTSAESENALLEKLEATATKLQKETDVSNLEKLMIKFLGNSALASLQSALCCYFLWNVKFKEIQNYKLFEFENYFETEFQIGSRQVARYLDAGHVYFFLVRSFTCLL